ncbi:MAG TPA: DUF4339 domain-containing protein [Bacteroidia bacterium]|nr:DUF4339 domain-containing protein [Bacteroidia bacterium]
MKKYYIHDGNNQDGPFSIDELKAKNINKDTPLWYEGLEKWTTAGSVAELNTIFRAPVPPPFEKQNLSTPPPLTKKEPVQSSKAPSQTSPKAKNPTGIILSIIGGVLLLILIFSAIQKHIGSDHSSGPNSTNYQETIKSAEEIERENPAQFLDAGGTYNQNFWGDAMKIHGNVKNKATVANYKDVVIEVVFYSNTNTELSRERYKIYDFFPAHSTKAFELKINRPAACTKLGWTAVDATPY